MTRSSLPSFRISFQALALAFALACAGGQPTPAAAQVSRTYAPERLWELSPADQRRIIGQEYVAQSSGASIPEDQMRFYLDQIRLSHWTFSQVRNDIGESLGGHVGGYPQQPQSGTIRCESTDSRQRTCNTPWAGNSEVVRQLSNTACIEGQNWFGMPGRVSVRGGCRAEFAQARWNAHGGGNNGQQIRCESDRGRYRQCGNGLTGDVQLVQQMSGSACVEGRTWGLRDGTIWVSGGCRGVFEVYSNAGWDSDYSVTCASQDGRYTRCDWDRSRGWPRLIQQLSSSPCIEGSTWGFDRGNTLWVDRGCRGRFGLH